METPTTASDSEDLATVCNSLAPILNGALNSSPCRGVISLLHTSIGQKVVSGGGVAVPPFSAPVYGMRVGYRLEDVGVWLEKRRAVYSAFRGVAVDVEKYDIQIVWTSNPPQGMVCCAYCNNLRSFICGPYDGKSSFVFHERPIAIAPETLGVVSKSGFLYPFFDVMQCSRILNKLTRDSFVGNAFDSRKLFGEATKWLSGAEKPLAHVVWKVQKLRALAALSENVLHSYEEFDKLVERLREHHKKKWEVNCHTMLVPLASPGDIRNHVECITLFPNLYINYFLSSYGAPECSLEPITLLALPVLLRPWGSLTPTQDAEVNDNTFRHVQKMEWLLFKEACFNSLRSFVAAPSGAGRRSRLFKAGVPPSAAPAAAQPVHSTLRQTLTTGISMFAAPQPRLATGDWSILLQNLDSKVKSDFHNLRIVLAAWLLVDLIAEDFPDSEGWQSLEDDANARKPLPVLSSCSRLLGRYPVYLGQAEVLFFILMLQIYPGRGIPFQEVIPGTGDLSPADVSDFTKRIADSNFWTQYGGNLDPALLESAKRVCKVKALEVAVRNAESILAVPPYERVPNPAPPAASNHLVALDWHFPKCPSLTGWHPRADWPGLKTPWGLAGRG